MSKLTEYFKQGKEYGWLTFLHHVEDYVSPKSGKSNAQGKFRCRCGREKTIRLYSVKNGNTLACGCQRGKLEFIKKKE